MKGFFKPPLLSCSVYRATLLSANLYKDHKKPNFSEWAEKKPNFAEWTVNKEFPIKLLSCPVGGVPMLVVINTPTRMLIVPVSFL